MIYDVCVICDEHFFSITPDDIKYVVTETMVNHLVNDHGLTITSAGQAEDYFIIYDEYDDYHS